MTHDFREGQLNAASFRQQFAPHLRHFLQHLDGHHQIEDGHYFPRFRALDTRMIVGFDLLENDHDIIHDRLLDTATSGQALIAALRQVTRRHAVQPLPTPTMRTDCSITCYGILRTRKIWWSPAYWSIPNERSPRRRRFRKTLEASRNDLVLLAHHPPGTMFRLPALERRKRGPSRSRERKLGPSGPSSHWCYFSSASPSRCER
jgi:hypothetical protein